MRTFNKTYTAIALALAMGGFAGMMSFSQSAKADAYVTTDPNVLYYDYQFTGNYVNDTGAPDTEITGNIILGLQFDASESDLLGPSIGDTDWFNYNSHVNNYNGGTGSATPVTYDVVSAGGSIVFQGGDEIGDAFIASGAPDIDTITGLVPLTTSNAPDDELFTSSPLPGVGINYAVDNAGLGFLLDLAADIPGVDVSASHISGTVELSTLDQNGNFTSDVDFPNDPSASANEQQVHSDSFTQVPEPGSIALLGAGLVGLGAFSRRRKQKRTA